MKPLRLAATYRNGGPFPHGCGCGVVDLAAVKSPEAAIDHPAGQVMYRRHRTSRPRSSREGEDRRPRRDDNRIGGTQRGGRSVTRDWGPWLVGGGLLLLVGGPSPTTRRNSGSRRVPTRIGRYGWRGGISRSARHHGPTSSSLVPRVRLTMPAPGSRRSGRDGRHRYRRRTGRCVRRVPCRRAGRARRHSSPATSSAAWRPMTDRFRCAHWPMLPG